MTMPEIRDTFTIKRGNLLPILVRRLGYADGSVYDLTGTTVELHIAPRDGPGPTVADAVTRTAAIVNAPGVDGLVSYTWVAGDVDEVGEFFCEFVVTNGTDTITFPNGESEYLLLIVTQDVDGA
jgi:hypothetical protein